MGQIRILVRNFMAVFFFVFAIASIIVGMAIVSAIHMVRSAVAPIVRTVPVIRPPDREIRIVVIRSIQRRIIAIIAIWIIPRSVTMAESKRKSVEIRIPGIRVKTHIEIIKRRPGVVGSTGVTTLVDDIGWIILCVIDTVFQSRFRIVIGHAAA